jgi:hypothetical protein
VLYPHPSWRGRIEAALRAGSEPEIV